MKKVHFLALWIIFLVSIVNAKFFDINNSPFKVYIEKSSNLWIISGYEHGLFKPNNPVNFSESLKISISAGEFSSLATNKNYSNITDWKEKYKKIYEDNFYYSNLKFSDTDVVTRDFAIYIILRQIWVDFSNFDYNKVPQYFSDISSSSNFWIYVNFAKYAGIVSGYPDWTFGVKNVVSRWEFTKMAYKTLIEDKDNIQKIYSEIISLNSAPEIPQKNFVNNSWNSKKTTTTQTAQRSTFSVSSSVKFLTIDEVKKVAKNFVEMDPNFVYLSSNDKNKILPVTRVDNGQAGFLNTEDLRSFTLFKTLDNKFFLSKNEKILNKREIINEMFNSINEYRKNNWLKILSLNEKLNTTAQAYSEEMFRTKHFDHISLNGENVGHRAEKNAYLYMMLLENIAFWQKTVSEAMTDFINSKWHNENILNTDVTEVGIWFYWDYWTQVFGSSR